MIELLSAERCVDCRLCVRVCPTNVFDAVEGGVPSIARQEDCQTCFMCEVYCPVDALFVAPLKQPARPTSRFRDEAYLVEHGLLGSYRRAVGWGKGRTPGAARDTSYVMHRFFGERPSPPPSPAAEQPR